MGVLRVQIGRRVFGQSTKEGAPWPTCLLINRGKDSSGPACVGPDLLERVGISCTGAKRKSDQVCEMLQVREPKNGMQR
jgi:hypothetical protein